MYGPDSESAKTGNGEIWTSIVHPGLVRSQLSGKVEAGRTRGLLQVFNMLGGYCEPDMGSWTSVFCAASPEFKKEQSGTYFERIAKKGSQSANAKNMELAERLEKWTNEQMVKEEWVK